MTSTDIADRVNEVKRSFKVPFDPNIATQELYDNVLGAIARNVKMGPFKATSGIELPCIYLPIILIHLSLCIEILISLSFDM
jgi:hypothetical protein